MSRKYRVIQWGVGYTGIISLRYILQNNALELVGVKCNRSEKEGKRASELCGVGSSPIEATCSNEALIALDADCVVYMGRDILDDPTVEGSVASAWMNDLVAILASGKNVVTSLTAGTHHRQLHDGASFCARLNEACAKGGTTITFTGFDPGFSDILALSMTSCVGAIRQINTWEVVDYGGYTVHETLKALGFGSRPGDLPPGGTDALRVVWGGVPHVVGDVLGVDIEEVRIETEYFPAPHSYISEGGLAVAEGTVAALRFAVTGYVNDKPLITVNHINRMGHDMARHWTRIGSDGGYIVEIDSYPPFRGEFPMGLIGGTGTTLADAMTMTAARVVNSIEAVVEAEPGYRKFYEIKPASGRYALAL